METDSQATITTEKDIPRFINEAGGHRLQRVSPTERRGRVHTSTVTVSVLMSEKTVSSNAFTKRNMDDYEYRWYSGQGKGGQKRNKTQNCLEITHLPTGISQKADGRSRSSNELLALEKLHEKLDFLNLEENDGKINKVRSDQIGSGMRGDKRRTYRFQDDSVHDHVTGKKTSCKRFMRGAIDKLWPKE